MKHLSVIRSALFALVMPILACDSATDNTNQQNSDEPNFLRLAANAPALTTTTVSFWAKHGEDRRGEIDFVAPGGGPDGPEFLKFRVLPTSLAFKPNGAPFAAGDSILITITVVDLDRMIFRLEPSGLRFSSSEPARLDLYYSQASQDFDRDGSIDDDDAAIETQLAIWKQEVIGGPWVKLGSIRDITIDEIEADITSFTGYAIAY